MILTQSAFAFSLIKFFGAIYLLYLGVKTYAKPLSEVTLGSSHHSYSRCFLRRILVSISNPKSYRIFYVGVSTVYRFIKRPHHSVAFNVGDIQLSRSLIHSVYSFIAHKAKNKLSTKQIS